MYMQLNILDNFSLVPNQKVIFRLTHRFSHFSFAYVYSDTCSGPVLTWQVLWRDATAGTTSNSGTTNHSEPLWHPSNHFTVITEKVCVVYFSSVLLNPPVCNIVLWNSCFSNPIEVKFIRICYYSFSNWPFITHESMIIISFLDSTLSNRT